MNILWNIQIKTLSDSWCAEEDSRVSKQSVATGKLQCVDFYMLHLFLHGYTVQVRRKLSETEHDWCFLFFYWCMKCFYTCIIKGGLEMKSRVSFEFKDDLTHSLQHVPVNAAVSYQPHYLLMSNIQPLHWIYCSLQLSSHHDIFLIY